MTQTRVWIAETDRYGVTNNKFSIDNPSHIPRVGEFVDSNEAAGYVNHIQYNYNLQDKTQFGLIVYIYLKETK